MIVECQKCGAPLSVVETQRLVQCSYCGATSQVRSTRTMAQPQPPAGWQPPPPPVYQPPPPVYQPPPPSVYRPAPAPAGGAVAALVVAGAIAAVGGVAAVLLLRGGASFAIRVDPSAPATVATVAVDAATPVARLIPGVAGGPISGGTVGPSCRGYFPVAPQFALRLTAAQRVRLTTLGNNDLTMAVRDPSGTFRCDDDSGEGSNPLVDQSLPAGLSLVWIGTFRRNPTAPFNFQVQSGEIGAAMLAAGLDLTTPPTHGVIALVGPATVATRPAVAGGVFDANTLGNNCRGYFSPTPQFVLHTTDYREVVLTTAAARDLTMVVRDAAGVDHCDDDSGGGSQPRVTALLGPGDHRVWIGTYSANQSAALTFTVQSHSTGAAAPLPNGLSPRSPPSVAVIDLDRTSATASLRGVVVGSLDARAIEPSCAGYLSSTPQLRLVTGLPRHVSITASSASDLALLARGPNGDMLCAVGARGGSNAVIEADIAAGETTVWVGAIGRPRAAFRVQVTAGPPSGTLPVK